MKENLKIIYKNLISENFMLGFIHDLRKTSSFRSEI
jgi:hypothetical protein